MLLTEVINEEEVDEVIQKNMNTSPLMDVYARFALAGSICCSFSHLVLVPLDVVKTKMQASVNISSLCDH